VPAAKPPLVIPAALQALLADAFLAGPWSARPMHQRAKEALGASPRGLGTLAKRILARFPEPPDRDALRYAIREETAGLGYGRPARRGHLRWPLDPFVFGARPPHEEWGLPRIGTTGDLAAALGLGVDELDWFADRKNLLRAWPEGPLQHYRWRWVPKRSGGWRLLETPKDRVKAAQRWVLRHILDRVPPHHAAHGFREGRSVLTFTAPHVGKAVVMRMDLEDFFPSIGPARIRALFRALGYPPRVAAALTGLCTARLPPAVPVPEGVPWRTVRRLRAGHLPQGAPTSPAIANLCAFGLDVRLAAAAAAVGAIYGRYADDLVFSGDAAFAGRARSFEPFVGFVAVDEGFAVQHRKTRFMRSGRRQRVTGVVVNAHPNVARDEYDVLKAILHNCAKHGPATQNRDGLPDLRAHLRGRVAWVEQVNPSRGAKLRALFDRISW
jgi:RNA-directed DNA polymerase